MGNAHPMGVNVPVALVADRGRPFDLATSWTFLAVAPTAGAVGLERKDPGDGIGDSLQPATWLSASAWEIS